MRILLFLLLSIISNLLYCQLSEETYTISDEVIANPERGLYHYTEVNANNYIHLNPETLDNYRNNENITLILRVIYIDRFLNGPISDEFLADLQKDFDIIRASGLKVIIRFAYTKRTSKPYGDAKPEMAYTHVRQIGQVMRANSDVIAVVHAGYVGAWGEWYYSDHFSGFSPSDVKEEHWALRRTLIQEMLDAYPDNIMVQMRTPGQKMRIMQDSVAITSADAYNNSYKSRLGHHNDCFVASANDVGTYVNAPLEKPYLEEDSKYTVMGGETCGVSSPYSDCENSLSELERFHWSYINIDYHPTVLQNWKNQGCFDEIERRLGYRFELNSTAAETNTHPEGTFSLNINMINTGYANIYNEKIAEIILKNTDSGKTYTYRLDEDARRWPIGENFQINISAGFPEDIEQGEYEVNFRITDHSKNLYGNPAYSIRFSNQDVWDSELGANKLAHTINIDTDAPQEPYSGTNYFTGISEKANSGESPDIWVDAKTDAITIFWGKTEKYEERSLYRKEESESGFQLLTTIPANLDYYTDRSIEADKVYRYYYTLENENDIIQSLEATSGATSSLEEPYVVDGMEKEWSNNVPSTSRLRDNYASHSLKAHFGLDGFYAAIYGLHDDVDIYINADNSDSTGIMDESVMSGMDYVIGNGKFLKVENGNWIDGSAEVAYASENNFGELGISSEYLPLLAQNTSVPAIAIIDGDTLWSVLGDAFDIYRSIPPDIPPNIEVSNSIPYPDSRLEVSWDPCSFCEFYHIEKSLDGDTFEEVKVYKSDKEIFYDDFLEDGKYYYRIRSRNALGFSDYSDIYSGTIGSVNVDDHKYSEITISPNPAHDLIIFSLPLESVHLYDLSGKLMIQQTVKSSELDISKLPAGTYILKGRSSKKIFQHRVIKH